jgi:hypothetical protein
MVIRRGDLARAIKRFRAEAHPDRHRDVAAFEAWCARNAALSLGAERYLQDGSLDQPRVGTDKYVRERMQHALSTLDLDAAIAAHDEQIANDEARQRAEDAAIDSRWPEIEAAFATPAHKRSNTQMAVVSELGEDGFLHAKQRRLRAEEERYKASIGYKLDQIGSATKSIVGGLLQLLSVLVWIVAIGLAFITLWGGVPVAIVAWLMWKIGAWLRDD